MVTKRRATSAAVDEITCPRCSCAFHPSKYCGGKYSIANIPASASSASRRGTAGGRKPATALIQAASLALRSIGARHSAATRSCDKARLTQKAAAPACTSQMSEDTPPGSRSSRALAPGGTNPERATKSRIAGSGQRSRDAVWSVLPMPTAILVAPREKEPPIPTAITYNGISTAALRSLYLERTKQEHSAEW